MIVDFLPLIAFFVAYKLMGLYAATTTLVAALTLQTGWQWWRQKRVDQALIITWVITFVLGSATLLLQDINLIKVKPTVVYWVFALAFAASYRVKECFLAEVLLGKQIDLAKELWKKVNTSFAIFFMLLGALNLYVVYYFSTDFWVDFKIFGTLGITLVYLLGLSWYFNRHGQKTTTDDCTRPAQ